jgi:hypothetical protein
MNFSSYIKKILLLKFLLLISIASINLIVDPQKIYASFFHKNKNPILQDFAKALESSNYGLINKFNELNERDRKKALAIYAEQKECAIIGSSHIMQISTYRNSKTLSNFCKSLINLGVSGGTLEDYLAFSNMLIERKKKIKTVIFSIDPWALNFHRDGRWRIHTEQFEKMQDKLKLVNKYNNSYTTSLLINLINLEYLKESFITLSNKNTEADNLIESKNDKFYHADKFNLEIGYKEYSVTLPDGSHSYNQEYRESSLQDMKSFDGTNYSNQHALESSKDFYDANAIKMFNETTILFQKSGINVIFLLSPYHQKTFETKQQIPKSLDIVEREIHDIAKSLKVTVIGSYRAENIPCSNNEFYDFAHPTFSCLLKLTNSIRNY